MQVKWDSACISCVAGRIWNLIAFFTRPLHFRVSYKIELSSEHYSSKKENLKILAPKTSFFDGQNFLSTALTKQYGAIPLE